MLRWKNASMEPTLTTELMSGITGTSTVGRHAQNAARSGAGSGGQIDHDAAGAAASCVEISLRQCFLRRRSRGPGVSGSSVTIWMGASPLAAGRAERAQHAGTLIAGAEEKRQQPIGSRVDQQNALAAGGERPAQCGHEAGFADAAGEREHRQHRRTRSSRGGHGSAWAGAPPAKIPFSANQREVRRSREPCSVSSITGGIGAGAYSLRSAASHAGREHFREAQPGSRAGQVQAVLPEPEAGGA